MGRAILQWVSLMAAGGDQGRGKDGKRSGVKCRGARTPQEREEKYLCTAGTGQKKPSCGCWKCYRYPWLFGSSASPYPLLFEPLAGSSLLLVLRLHPYGGCVRVPRAWQGGEWEEGPSWTLVLLFSH